MVRKALILLMLGSILATAGAALLLLQSDDGKAFITVLAQQTLEEATGLSIHVGDVEVRPFHAEVELLDVRVDGPGAPSLGGAQSVVFGVAPLQLMGGTVTISRLDVVRPYANVIVRDGWIVGVPRLPAGNGPATRPNEDMFIRLFVQQFRMTGLNVHVQVEGKHPVDVVLTDLRAALDARDGDTHQGVFSLGQGVITLPNGRKATLAALDGRATLHGEGLLRPEQLDVESARMRLDNISCAMHGAVRFAPLSTGLIPAADLVLEGHVPFSQFNAYADLLPFEGTADFNAHFRSAFGGKNPTLIGSGDIRNCVANEFVIGNWTGNFVADPTGVDFTDVKSDFAAADIRGQGRVDFARDFREVKVTMSARGTHASFARGMANIRVPGSWVEFNIDADVDFEGTLYPEFKFAGVGDAFLTNFRVYNQSHLTAQPDDLVMAVGPTTGHSRMEFDLTHFSFVNGTLSDGKTTVTGDVFLPLHPEKVFTVDGTADPVARPGEMFDCATLSPIGPVHLTCHGPGIFHVKGLYNDPKIWGSAVLSDVSIEGYHLGEAAGQFDYDQLLFRIFNVKGKKKDTTWEGRADLNWRAYLGVGPDGKKLKRPMTRRDTLFVTVEGRNVVGKAEDIRSVIPPGWGNVMEYLRTVPVDGNVSGWADARGAIGDGKIDDLTFETEFNIGALSAYGQQFEGEHVSAHMDKQKFHFDDLTLKRAGSNWHAQGSIARGDAAIRMDVRVDNMPVKELDSLAEVPMELAGTFDAVANVRGAIGDWQGPVRLDVHNVQVGDIPVGNGGLDLVMTGTSIKGVGPIFDSRAALQWKMKLEPPWQFVADVQADRGPVQDLVGPNALPKNVTLTLAGAAHAEGALSEARKTRGNATLTQLALGYQALAARTDGDVKLHFQGDKVTFDQLAVVTDDQSRMDVRGNVSGSALDLDLEIKSDLSTAKLFVPSLKEAYGPINLRLSVSGTPDVPVLVGQGTLSQGQFSVEGFPHQFRNIDTPISFIRDRVVLDPMVLTLDDSPVRGHADVALKKFSIHSIMFNATFRDLKFRVPDYVPSTLTGSIFMSGTPSDMLLTGDIDVQEAHYQEQWEWERIGLEFRRRRLNPKVYDRDKEWLSFDLHLRADDRIYVKNDSMDAEFKGDLHITGTNERVGMVGTLTALGGRAYYRNNTFELGRSTVDFVERQRIAVVVDVEARTRVKGYDIWVDVNGPVEQLSAERGIRLYSRPDLPAVDVLSLVLFGFTQSDVNQGNSTSGAVAFMGGLDFATRATGVDKEVRRVLPKQVVDEFYLTSRTPRRATGAAQGSVPAVVVGTELWPGTRLRLTTTILDPSGNTNDQSVELEKRWGEHWSGRLVWDRTSSLQQYGDAGGDLRYRWEF